MPPARVLPALMVLLTAILWTAPVRAGSVVRLTPEQVLASADALLLARVESATPRRIHGPDSWIVTDYRIVIERVVHDAGFLSSMARDGHLTLTFSGGQIGEEGCLCHGVPTLTVGERAFMVLRKDHLHAVCPIVGWWQGLYRIRTVNGVDRVFHADSCCGSPTLVTSGFFPSGPLHPDGFSTEQFFDELARAFPRALADPSLAFERIRPPAGHLELAAALTTTWGLIAPTSAPGCAQPVPDRRPGTAVIPAVDRPFLSISAIDSDNVRARSPFTARYGFSKHWPNDDYTSFNVPPALGSFRDQFIDAENEWNFVCSDVFRYRTNSDNSIGTPNLRNDFAFLTDSQRDDLFGGGWGPTELGVCHVRYIGDIITETDIGFNAAMNWTTDAQTARTTGRIYFFPVAIHELGHAFGLQHQWDADPGANFLSVMNYYAPDQLYQTAHVFADDARACRSFYGARTHSYRDAGVYMLRNDGTRTGSTLNTNTVQWATFPSSVNRGSSFQLANFTVDNPGTQITNVTLSHWLCPSNGSFDGAIYCGSSTIYALASGSSGWFTRTFGVPPGAPLGSYYPALSLSADDDGTNNACWSRTTITVNAPRPFNDEWTAPGVIDDRGGTITGTTIGATASITGCASSNGPDVWFRYIPPASGTLKLDTCSSSFDTVLELFESSSTSALGTSVRCNDDGAAFTPCPGTVQSYIAQPVSFGNVYFVRLAGFNGGSGDYTLRTTLVPSNDSCTNAFPLNDIGVVIGTTLNAAPTGAGNFAPCNLGTIVGTVDMEPKPDVWYAFTPACSGPITFSARGTGAIAGAYFTVAVYDRCLAFGGVPLLSCGEPDAGIDAIAGTTYYLRVRAVQEPGDFALSIISHDLNDECFDLFSGIPGEVRLTAESLSQTVTATTVCASPNATKPPISLEGIGGAFDPGRDVWFNIITDSPGQLRITRCSGDFFPVLALYDACLWFGPPQPVPSQIASGWSTDPDCNLPIIDYPVEAGRYYVLRVGGTPFNLPDRGTTQLTISLLPRATGACCSFDGTCTLTDLLSCGTQEGAYQGDDTACDPVPCVVPVGACCDADGSCTQTPAEVCAAAGRLYFGAGFTCEPAPCTPPEPPLGACCTGSLCNPLTDADCAAVGGSWLGEFTACDPDPANPVVCCTANFNGAGGVSVQDIFDFLASYFAADPRTDINHSGAVTVQDIFDFLASYFTGCG